MSKRIYWLVFYFHTFWEKGKVKKLDTVLSAFSGKVWWKTQLFDSHREYANLSLKLILISSFIYV